jgi:sialate O-acetylesterase
MNKSLFCAATLFLMAGQLNAKIKLQPMFTSNMVLQQKSDAPIWGEATPDKTVTVVTSWNGQKYTIKADAQGKWRLNVSTPSAGGPYDITISDGKKVVLSNVLIGEVWLCTGQSNMEMPMQGWDVKMNADAIAESGKYKNIRMLQVNEVYSTTTRDDISVRNGGWMTCSPETVKDFSATGYFFGKNLNDDLNVPVGLIMTCWGGTAVETWISPEKLVKVPEFKDRVEDIMLGKKTDAERYQEYQDQYHAWFKSEAQREGSVNAQGNAVYADPAYNDAAWKTMPLPNLIDVAGLSDFDGHLWFRKTINIPAAWAGKDLELNLANVDDNDITWFNGVRVGETMGYNVHRRYIIPGKLVKAGKAVITVSDLDGGGGGGIWGEAQNLNIRPLKGNNDVLSLAGHWRYKIGSKLLDMASMPTNNSMNQYQPVVLYNSMINPLIPYTLAGAIWYQGEANADRAYQYRDLLPLMIADWRGRWGKDFPFYIMQLANYQQQHKEPVECAWAELREAQLMTARNVANCGMAVNIDLGAPNNIHPLTKSEVGRRLAVLAEAKTYGQKVPYSGPEYESYTIERGQIRLSFRHAQDMKTADGGRLKGFAVAGADHKFHWADARIEGNTIVVSSPAVDDPLAVRYAWDDDPACNLTNHSNLPASPFRTDQWPGVTLGKK